MTQTSPRIPLKDTVGYMLAHACKHHRQRADELLNEIGLHVGQEMLLCGLWEKEGVTQTELAEYVMIQPATVTNMLQRLERGGFVERRPDIEDQRVSRVYTTEKRPRYGRGSAGEVESVRTGVLRRGSASKRGSCSADCSFRFTRTWADALRSVLFFMSILSRLRTLFEPARLSHQATLALSPNPPKDVLGDSP